MQQFRRFLPQIALLSVPLVAVACDEDEASLGLEDTTYMPSETKTDLPNEEALDPTSDSDAGASADFESNSDPQPSPLASGFDLLNSCRWYRDSSANATSKTAKCPDGYKPISGGCYSSDASNEIVRSHPFEMNSATNLPENGEYWYATDGDTGWRCKGSKSSHIEASILCCGSPN